MIRMADSAARSRIRAARARPSVSGMRASSSTSGYGRPTLAASQRTSMAATPSPTAVGSICQSRSHSSRMWRLVALSSTTRTRRSRSRTGGRAGVVSVGCGWRPNLAVKAKVLPRPGSLSTVIVPPIRATRRAAIDRPSPVPPYLRVVEVSSCSKARKIFSCLSGGMPMPVSLTANRTPTSSGAGSPATSTRTTTSPSSVNLMALPTRLSQHLPQPAGVADQGVGHVRLHVADQLQPLPVGPHGQGPQGVTQGRPQGEVGRVQLELAGLDLGEVEQVVDDAQQVVGGRLDRPQALPLVLGQRRVEDQLGHAEDGVHGGADLVADVGQELVLGPVGRLRRLRPLPPGDALFEDRSRLVLLGDVHRRPDVLEVARFISDGLCQDPDIFDGTIRHQEAMFEIHVRPVAEGAIEGLLHEGAVVRMNSLEDPLEGRPGRPVEANDSIGLVRPVDFSAGKTPAETARMTQSLRLRQISLAPPQVGIEAGVLQRDRGLRGQQFQHREPGRREDVGRQVVLEVEHADQLGLLHQGQAEDGPGALLAEVLIRRERVRGRGVIQDHALSRPDHGVEEGFGQLGRCHRFLSERDLDRLPVGPGLRFDPRRVAPEEDEQAALGAGLFERERHQGLDEPVEDDLTGDGLRGLDHRADVQVLDGGAEQGGGRRRGGVLAELRVGLLELPDLAQGAPAEITVPCVPQIGLGDGLEAARRVEPRGHLMGQAFVLHEAVLASRLNGLLVQSHGIDVASFEAGDLGRHQGVLVGERRRVGFGPLAQLFPVRRQEVAPPGLLVGRSLLIERRHRQRGVVKVVE